MVWYYKVEEKASRKTLIETHKWQRAIDKWSRSNTNGIDAHIIGYSKEEDENYLGYWDTMRLIQKHSEWLKKD